MPSVVQGQVLCRGRCFAGQGAVTLGAVVLCTVMLCVHCDAGRCGAGRCDAVCAL